MPFRNLLKVSALFFAGLFCVPAEGQAYRPFATEDADVLDLFELEIEMGHDYLDDGNNNRSFEGSYSFNASPLKNLELNLLVPIVYHHRESSDENGLERIRARGTGDLELLAKHLMFEGSDRLPAFTPTAIISFPTGNASKGLGSGTVDYEALGVFSYTWHRLTTHANIGYAFLRNENDLLIYRFAADIRVLPRVSLAAEWGAAADFDRGTRKPVAGILAELSGR